MGDIVSSSHMKMKGLYLLEHSVLFFTWQCFWAFLCLFGDFLCHPLSLHYNCSQYFSTPMKDESKCIEIEVWPLTNTNTCLCSIKLGSYINAHLYLWRTGRWVVLDFGFSLRGIVLKVWSHSSHCCVWLQSSQKLRREEWGREAGTPCRSAGADETFH